MIMYNIYYMYRYNIINIQSSKSSSEGGSLEGFLDDVL